METFAVTVVPVAKPDEWRAWVDSIASGDRADAHRQMMRRLGIKREHIRHQASPDGDVMLLVWEGVEQDRMPKLLADLVQNPQSEHAAVHRHPRDPGSSRRRPNGRSAADGAESRHDRNLKPSSARRVRHPVRTPREPRWEPPGRTTLSRFRTNLNNWPE